MGGRRPRRHDSPTGRHESASRGSSFTLGAGAALAEIVAGAGPRATVGSQPVGTTVAGSLTSRRAQSVLSRESTTRPISVRNRREQNYALVDNTAARRRSSAGRCRRHRFQFRAARSYRRYLAICQPPTYRAAAGTPSQPPSTRGAAQLALVRRGTARDKVCRLATRARSPWPSGHWCFQQFVNVSHRLSVRYRRPAAGGHWIPSASRQQDADARLFDGTNGRSHRLPPKCVDSPRPAPSGRKVATKPPLNEWR